MSGSCVAYVPFQMLPWRSRCLTRHLDTGSASAGTEGLKIFRKALAVCALACNRIVYCHYPQSCQGLSQACCHAYEWDLFDSSTGHQQADSQINAWCPSSRKLTADTLAQHSLAATWPQPFFSRKLKMIACFVQTAAQGSHFFWQIDAA